MAKEKGHGGWLVELLVKLPVKGTICLLAFYYIGWEKEDHKSTNEITLYSDKFDGETKIGYHFSMER